MSKLCQTLIMLDTLARNQSHRPGLQCHPSDRLQPITLISFIQETSKCSSQGSKGTGHFFKQTAIKEKVTEPKCRDVHDVQTPVSTEARENIHQTISIIRRLVQNRRGPLGYTNCAWGNIIPFVNQPPLAI